MIVSNSFNLFNCTSVTLAPAGGKTMKNYTINLGQSNDFVHSIYKDNNDELWFVLTNGNAFKFNGKTFDKQF